MAIAVIGFLLGVTLVVLGSVTMGLDPATAAGDHTQLSAWLLGSGAFLMVATAIGYARHRLRHAESVPEELHDRSRRTRRSARLGEAGEPETVSVNDDRFAVEVNALPPLSARMEMHGEEGADRVSLAVVLPLVAIGGFFIFIASFLIDDEGLRPLGLMLGGACGFMILYLLWRAVGGGVRFRRPRRARLNWTHTEPVGRTLLIRDARRRVARLGPEYLTVPELLEIHGMSFQALLNCVLTGELGSLLDSVAPRRSTKRQLVFDALYRRVEDPDEAQAALAVLLAYPTRAHLAHLERAQDAILRSSTKHRIQETMDEIERRLTEMVGAVSLDEDADRGQVSLAREGAQLSVVDSDD